MSNINNAPTPPKKLNLLLTVVNRGDGIGVSQKYRSHGVAFNIIAPARGAAGTDILDLLGISETEKDLIISVVIKEYAKKILNLISREFHFEKPGTGVIMSIPIVGVSGPRAYKYISHGGEEIMSQNNDLQEQKEKEGTTYSNRQFNLIVTVVNRGFADNVIDACKEVGPRGGTILYARGTGIHEVEKFFGMSIQPEKEVVLSVVRRSVTRAAVHEIVEQAGLSTEGRGLCFVLPIEDVAGFQHPIDFSNLKKAMAAEDIGDWNALEPGLSGGNKSGEHLSDQEDADN